MGPKKKKNAYNDFYFFMQEQKKGLRREGRSWDNMDDLAAICHSRWRLVPDNDKARYKQMAKMHKEDERKNLANKFDAQGRSLLSLEEERQTEKRKIEKMVKEISEIIDAETLSKTLPDRKFFFLHINTLVEAGEKKFFPCEMAVVEFSLKNGISTIFHTYMRPEDSRIPMGYSFEIQQNASESHGLPFDCEPMQMREASSWSWIVAKFLDMVNPKRYDEAFPPLFTIGDDVEKIEIMLEAIFAWGDQKMRHDIRIYHIEELFNSISQKLTQERRFPKSGGAVFATTQLETDKYTFSQQMACNWHDYDERPQFCSLQKLKSWAYVISQHCCEDFKINLLSGRHKPLERAGQTEEQKKKNQPIKMINICPWRAPGVKDDEVSNAPTNELFGHVPKTKAAPAGYTPFVPEGCGLLVNKNNQASGGGGLTWADCDDDDEEYTVNTNSEPPKLNAMGKEASPAIPSPAFYVWGATASEKPQKQPVSHLSKTSVNPNIITSNPLRSDGVQNTAHQSSEMSRAIETEKIPNEESKETEFPAVSEINSTNEATWISEKANAFPNLGEDNNFPPLAHNTSSAPSKGKGKKGRGRKGQTQLLTFGVQRMNIN